jgi:hypothetical protein
MGTACFFDTMGQKSMLSPLCAVQLEATTAAELAVVTVSY